MTFLTGGIVKICFFFMWHIPVPAPVGAQPTISFFKINISWKFMWCFVTSTKFIISSFHTQISQRKKNKNNYTHVFLKSWWLFDVTNILFIKMKLDSYRCIIHSLKSLCFISCQKHGNKVLYDFLRVCFVFTISCDIFINEFLMNMEPSDYV